jgi:hypothetical protein
MEAKIDISSKTVEKSLDVAKDFLQKLIGPSIEEAGLLMRDSVAMWRFKNQINVLHRASEICARRGITPSPISIKLLCPLLESASLEDTPKLQVKWSILLSNMVDSEKNIQNHVFPYILSQLSRKEFDGLEALIQEKRGRVIKLSERLSKTRESIQEPKSAIYRKMDELGKQRAAEQDQSDSNQSKAGPSQLNAQWFDCLLAIMELEQESDKIESEIAKPQELPSFGLLQEYEISNLVRLGLIKSIRETYALPLQMLIRNEPDERFLLAESDVNLHCQDSLVITELAELLIAACSED